MRAFTLYRFYAADNTLLYVGLTINPGRRLEKHRALQPWWNDVARVDLEQHPDLPTLRASEREAIKTEGPLYNISMNARYAETYLTWSCDVCKRPIPDDAGYITVPYAEIHAHREWNDEFDEMLRIRGNGGLAVYTLGELNGMPDRARWHALHRSCDPNLDSNDYWIGVERIRTYPQVLEWSAHLLSKTWITDTTWQDILRRAAA
jgi:hypothetical protein